MKGVTVRVTEKIPKHHPKIDGLANGEKEIGVFSTERKSRFNLRTLANILLWCRCTIPRYYQTVYLTNRRVIVAHHSKWNKLSWDSKVYDEQFSSFASVHVQKTATNTPLHNKMQYNILKLLYEFIFFFSFILPFLAMPAAFGHPFASLAIEVLAALCTIVNIVWTLTLMFKKDKSSESDNKKAERADLGRAIAYFIFTIIALVLDIASIVASVLVFIACLNDAPGLLTYYWMNNNFLRFAIPIICVSFAAGLVHIFAARLMPGYPKLRVVVDLEFDRVGSDRKKYHLEMVESVADNLRKALNQVKQKEGGGADRRGTQARQSAIARPQHAPVPVQVPEPVMNAAIAAHIAAQSYGVQFNPQAPIYPTAPM